MLNVLYIRQIYLGTWGKRWGKMGLRDAKERERKREERTRGRREHLFHRSNSIAVYSAAALIFYYVVIYFKMHN